jgi:hypothetical protein
MGMVPGSANPQAGGTNERVVPPAAISPAGFWFNGSVAFFIVALILIQAAFPAALFLVANPALIHSRDFVASVGSISIPMYRRPLPSAALAVVPVPWNGSRTKSPGLEATLMMRSTSFTGS